MMLGDALCTAGDGHGYDLLSLLLLLLVGFRSARISRRSNCNDSQNHQLENIHHHHYHNADNLLVKQCDAMMVCNRKLVIKGL